MLYIFHADYGKMLVLEMHNAMKSVQDLKTVLESDYGVPAEKQVLIINGGEVLQDQKMICSYSAGTDTNPIYLFSNSYVKGVPQPVLRSFEAEKLREYFDMPATLGTLKKRTQLAQEFYKLAQSELEMCQGLVHDQHMQHQAWSAVMANLEDIKSDLSIRSENFLRCYQDYLSERGTYFESLKGFEEYVVILKKIPMLSVLIELGSTTIDDTVTKSPEKENMNLFEWMSDTNAKTIDHIYDLCLNGLERNNELKFQEMKNKIESIIPDSTTLETSVRSELQKRLSGLNELMNQARDCEKQQKELSESFLKNQNSARDMKDQSILPDLCTSHVTQLKLMAANHEKICDIKRRITSAKEELCGFLHEILHRLSNFENSIHYLNEQIRMSYHQLEMLLKNLQIVQQIRSAPTTYLATVAEVVRRRAFSQSYLLWTSEMACHLLTIHNEEVTRRKDFESKYSGHFLYISIPGLYDVPPDFATQAPPMFDSDLPKITEDDFEMLKKHLPELMKDLQLPDMSAAISFFSRSLVKKEEEKLDETEAVEEKLVRAVSGGEPVPGCSGLSHLKDLDRGCESETDTEEFVNVGQSPLELNFDRRIPSPRQGTQDASTVTEDDLQISRSEHDKLKSVVVTIRQLTTDAALQLRSELNELKIQVLSDKSIVSQQYESLSSSWENLILEMDNKEKELVDSLKKDHEETVNNLKKLEKEKDDKIENLLMEKTSLELEMKKSCENLSELQENINKISVENQKKIEELVKQIQEKDVEKEKNIKEITDRLNREHKAEIENIRSRFKLMTMERSPSESNLEKSSEFSSLSSNHSTLLLQMTENFELDKEKAVNEAIQKENQKWEQLLSEKIKEMETTFTQEKEVLLESVGKRIAEEKDKQIEVLRQREDKLNLECIKYKNMVEQLTETQTDKDDTDTLERINNLQKEKEILEEELKKLKSEKLAELEASVSVYEGKVDATTSPVKQKDLSKSEIVTSKPGKLTIEACKAGDHVLILWDIAHSNFKILQESKHLYFLHSECLEVLGLLVVDGVPNKDYCIGEVVDKEYCHARKAENRYRVPKGTKFFRVRAQPLVSSTAPKETSQSFYQSRSTASDVLNSSLNFSTSSAASGVIPEERIDSRSQSSSPVRDITLSCYPAVSSQDSGIASTEQVTVQENVSVETQNESLASELR